MPWVGMALQPQGAPQPEEQSGLSCQKNHAQAHTRASAQIRTRTYRQANTQTLTRQRLARKKLARNSRKSLLEAEQT